MPFFIVGLGNPGEEYRETRHNTGRIITEALATIFSLPDFKENIKIKALVSKGEVSLSKNHLEKIEIINPNNFMNRSGPSVAGGLGISMLTSKASRIKKAHNLIVIYDDLDLPLGKIKVSFNRSSGGHRGVESIIKSLKTQEFIRIRVGISPVTPSGKLKKPSGEAEVEKHIIGVFKKLELEHLQEITERVIEAVKVIITEGKEKAMERFNN